MSSIRARLGCSSRLMFESDVLKVLRAPDFRVRPKQAAVTIAIRVVRESGKYLALVTAPRALGRLEARVSSLEVALADLAVQLADDWK